MRTAGTSYIRSTLVKDTLDLRGEYVLLFAQDMTSIRKIEEANRQLMLTSRHDKLTGLLNRAAAEKLIAEHLDLVGASSRAIVFCCSTSTIRRA